MRNNSHPNDDEKSSGLTIGDVIGGIRNTIIAGRDIILGTTAEQRAQRNRRAMLELVKNTWIKGVLEQSLHGAAMIELGMEERADAVEHPWDMVLQTPDRPKRVIPRGTKIVDVFDEMNGALLILGEPGSGKTTMLLELARETIARAEEDPTQPIPVVFNLSSWADKRQPIAEWLVDELNVKYNIPKRIARPWVENDDLLLLLDGLDEVKQEYREACVKALNDFRQEHGLTPIVVCSRVADYDVLTTQIKLDLYHAVLLQSLTAEQINKYLEGTGIELLAVRETLSHDATFQELARSPLMLNVMILAYQGISIEDLSSFDTITARRRHVFDVYVQRMFKRRGAHQPYSPEQTTHWLAWLAQKMSKHGPSVLLLNQMQLNWLQRGVERGLYTSMVNLIEGLSIALIGGLSLCIIFGMVFRMSSELTVVLTSIWIIVVLSIKLILGLVSGLIAALTDVATEIVMAPYQFALRSPKYIVIIRLLSWLFAGLLLGLSFERLRYGIGKLVMDGLNAEPIMNGPHIKPMSILAAGPVIGLGLGLIAELWFRILALIEGFALRFTFYRKGYTPWNLGRFLDYAAERIFLRKVGGGYIFVHRLLQDYFASLYQEA